MDTFFIEYRDPLFGVIVFFVMMFILSFLSYWWGRYKTNREHSNLESFLGKFESLGDEAKIGEQVRTDSLTSESWLTLAQCFEQKGNFEKSVDIYHALLSKHRDRLFQKEVLLLLGKTFFKAGFLERSRQSFLQVLHHSPRTPVALRYLILIYEQLGQLDKALEVMESLEELVPDTKSERMYLECKALFADPSKTVEEKASGVLRRYTEEHLNGYMVFEWLFTHRPALAWKIFDESLSEKLSDVLWRLSDEHLNLDIISGNGYLREFFSAKGAVSLAENSTVFEFDTLIALRRCGEEKATLQFEYGCDECKQISFLPFYRCPHCHAIDTVFPVISLAKERFEDYYSFQ